MKKLGNIRRIPKPVGKSPELSFPIAIGTMILKHCLTIG